MLFRKSNVQFVLPALVFTLTGCGDPDIRTYTAPKAQPVPAGYGYRIIGAMVPAEEPVWFFKMMGSESDIDGQEAAFDAFLSKVTFPDGPGGKPKWELSDGVREGPPREMRYATILFGSGAKPFELSVSEAKGGKEANLKRWVGQVEATSASTSTKPITIGGINAIRVSMTGSKNPSVGGMMGRR